MDWFLYDNGLQHERVKVIYIEAFTFKHTDSDIQLFQNKVMENQLSIRVFKQLELCEQKPTNICTFTIFFALPVRIN